MSDLQKYVPTPEDFIWAHERFQTLRPAFLKAERGHRRSLVVALLPMADLELVEFNHKKHVPPPSYRDAATIPSASDPNYYELKGKILALKIVLGEYGFQARLDPGGSPIDLVDDGGNVKELFVCSPLFQ